MFYTECSLKLSEQQKAEEGTKRWHKILYAPSFFSMAFLLPLQTDRSQQLPLSTDGSCMIQIICGVEQMYQVDKPYLGLGHRIELNSDCLCLLNDSLISTSQSLKETFQITKVAVVYRDFIYFSCVKSVRPSSCIKQLLRMTRCSFYCH